MPEALFRGKPWGSDEWAYGGYCSECPFWIIQKRSTGRIARVVVDEYTIGQYTTVDDRKGEKIFAGDIVKTKEFGRDDCGLNHPGYDTFMVVWHNAAWCIENSLRRFRLSDAGESLERIGNKWDNPELVEEVNRER